MCDGFIQSGNPCCGSHPCKTGVLAILPVFRLLAARNCDIFLQRSGEQEGLLQDHADISSKPVRRNVRDVHTTNLDPSVFRRKRIQTVKEIHQGRFSGAGSSQNSDRAPRRNGEGDVLQYLRGAVFILIRHMLKRNIPVHGRHLGILFILLCLRIHDVTQAVDGDSRLGHIRHHAAKRADRPRQHGIVIDKCNVLSRCNLSADTENCADHGDQHHLQTGNQIT